MTYKTFRRICTAILISLALMLEVKAQIPVYGSLEPEPDSALDLGSTSNRWDTIFVNAIYPPVSGSGIWSELNDSVIIWVYGGDTIFIGIADGDIFTGQYKGSNIYNYMTYTNAGTIEFQVNGNNPYSFLGTSATQAALSIFEDTDNGGHFLGLKPPASLAASYTLTFPADDGSADQVLTTNGTGTLSWTAPSAISPFVFLQGDSQIIWQSTPGALLITQDITGIQWAHDLGLQQNWTTLGFEFGNDVLPTDSGVMDLGTGAKYWNDSYINNINTFGIVDKGSTVNTTAADTATINAISGRFRKDTSGATFTVTNSYITANSIVILTAANAAIDATATQWTVDVSGGNILVTFDAAPSANFDMNFLIIN